MTNLMYAIVAAAALLLASTVAVSYGQDSPTLPSNSTAGNATTNTTTATANGTDFETARQQYLEAWNQTAFYAIFDTFIEPNSEQGFGAYTLHGSDVFRPGDTITLYVEPVGFSHDPVLDEQGNTLYQMNLTAAVTIEDELGNVVGTIEDFPPLVLISHNKNTEIYMTITVTQEQPFPVGTYKMTYTIADSTTEETFIISKSIRVAQTVP